MKKVCRAKGTTAFSLIEMLLSIAIIGVIAAIAIPQISTIRNAADQTADRRNAQSLASVFASAQSAGLDFYVAGDKAATIQAIVDGGTVAAEGPMQGVFFGVPNMSVADQNGAAAFLQMNDSNSIIMFVTP